MSTLDLPDRYLARLRELLRAQVPTAEVWAYGSRVDGNAHEASDLDLVLRHPGDLSQPQPNLFALKEALEESDIPILVDVLDWARLPESFHEQIRRGYVVVQGDEAGSGESGEGGGWGMPWKDIRLGELVKITHGWAFKSEYFSTTPSNLPIVVNIGNFRYEGGFRFEETQAKRYTAEFPKECELIPGDILLAMTCQTPGGEILGIPGKIPNDGQTYLHNQRLGRLITKDATQVSSDFLYWLCLWRDFNHELCATATGTKILHTAPARIENFEFLCPPIGEQEAIAEILSSLDEKIELNRKQNRTLEAIAQALFKRWFVEFEFPDENGRPYKSSGGAMQPSALGEIPVGWVVKPLDQIADYLNGLALQKFPPEGDEYLPVIKIREMKQGVTANSDKASTKLDPKYIVDDGDVLFSWSGSLEMDIWCHGKGALNQHLFKVTSEDYPKWFYYLWTKHHLRAFQAVAADKATTMGHIQRGHLSDALTVCPPDEMLPVLSDTFDSLIDKVISCRIESRTLSRLRDILLPKLMSGELRVGDAA